MKRYLVELDGDQIELLMGMVREAMKVADENKIPELEALLSALGIMSGRPEIAGATDRMGQLWKAPALRVRPHTYSPSI